jgi:small subunit ribosomal protein S6
MPLYNVVAILKAAATRPSVSEVLRRAAVQVMDAGGVVTDIKSYGTRELAYEIRKAGETHKQVRAVPRRALVAQRSAAV